MEYSTGDQVVVPNCGVGLVDAIETMDMGEGDVQLYRIDFGEDEGRMWIPVDKVAEKRVRPPMTEERVEEAWDIIASQEAPKKRANWNRRQRRYTEMIMSNSPTSLARLLGELAAVREKKKLSFTEKRIYRKVWDLVVDEMAAARGVTREEIEQKMDETLPSPAPA